MNSRWLKFVLRWINLHPRWRRGVTQVWGSRLRAPTFDRWLALQLHRWRRMGVDDRKFLSAQITPGMTVVDIGANQGLYTLLFARITGGEGSVLAFEPDPLLYDALRENIRANHAETVQVYPTALGSKPGTMTLYRSLLNSGDNRLAAKSAAGNGPRDGVTVAIERLDQVLAGQTVDFIKMDVQGWEMEVFRGMSALLTASTNRKLAIYFEHWPDGLRDAGSDPAEPLKFLVAHDFTIYSLKEGVVAAPVDDVDVFLRSVPRSAYVNLFAVRPGSS